MSQPTIAVLMPVHNVGRFMRAALDSVFAQTSRPDELIIVDNASTDETPAIAQEYAREPWVRVERNAENLGGPRNWKRAAELATADHISWLPGDDILRPDCIARWRDAAARHPEAGLFLGGFTMVDADGRPLPQPVVGGGLPAGSQPGATLVDRMVAHGQPNIVAGTVIRRSDYEAVGGIDDRLRGAIDFDLFLRIAGRARVFIDPEPNAVNREHPDRWMKAMLAHDNGDSELLFEKVAGFNFLNEEQVRAFVGRLCDFSRQYYMRLLLAPQADVAQICGLRQEIRARLRRWRSSGRPYARFVRLWPRKLHSWAAWLAGTSRFSTWALHGMLSRRSTALGAG